MEVVVLLLLLLLLLLGLSLQVRTAQASSDRDGLLQERLHVQILGQSSVAEDGKDVRGRRGRVQRGVRGAESCVARVSVGKLVMMMLVVLLLMRSVVVEGVGVLRVFVLPICTAAPL